MSRVPLGLSPYRDMTPSDVANTSEAPLILHYNEIDYSNDLLYASAVDALCCEAPRSLDGNVRAATHLLGYPELGNLPPSETPDFQALSVLPVPSTSRVLPRDRPCETIEPAEASITGPTRVAKSHSRRQPPGHIPRPRNAFILYRSWYVRTGLVPKTENDHREISRIVGKVWKKLTDMEKQPWKVLAEEEKIEHARKYPNYKYSPNSRRDAASLSSRGPSNRSSTTRGRKAKAAGSLNVDQSDDAARAFSAPRDRRHNATTRARENEIAEVTAERRAPVLSIRIPAPSNRPPPEPQRPCTPAQSSVPEDLSYSPSLSDSPSTPSEKPKKSVPPGTPPLAMEGQAIDNASWVPDLDFTHDSDALFLLSPYSYSEQHRLHAWAIRPGHSGDASLNSIMHPNLLYSSWGNAYDDLDAYERSVGVSKGELDDYRAFFGADGLMETQG